MKMTEELPLKEPLQTERTWEIEGFPVLRLSLCLPQPAQTAADPRLRRIQSYYRLQARSCLRYCQRRLFPQARGPALAALGASQPVPCLLASLSFCVTWNRSGLFSLWTQLREKAEGSPALLTRWGDTWDLRTGYPLPLSDFFPDSRHWKQPLLTAAEASMARQEAAGLCRWHPGWRRELRKQFNPQNFYLTADGLTVFFPQFALGPAAEGIPVFTLPRDFPDASFPPL